MNCDGVGSITCDAQENDWLDVTYAERNYIGTTASARGRKRVNKKQLIVAAICLCVAVLACFVAFDADFRSGIVTTAKNAFQAVASALDGKQDDVSGRLDIPCNVMLESVENGVATFGGGRAVLCFASGVVSNVGEDSVTVRLSDTTSIVYGGLTSVLVVNGEELSANDLVGKYENSFTASLLQNGEAVTTVSATEAQLIWSV